MQLTEKQRRHLKGLAHPLRPVILMGQAGLTDAVVAETTRALADHELIKVRLPGLDRTQRDAALQGLAERTGSAMVTRIGHVAVLYRRGEPLPRIVLPDQETLIAGKNARPRVAGKLIFTILAGCTVLCGQRLFEATDTLSFTVGGDVRYDDIHKVQVDHTDQRTFIDHVSAHSANELSLAVFTEGTWRASDQLRVTAGLRGDQFHTHATQPGFGEGDATESLASPKLAIAWKIDDYVETQGNWGRGYHSNDARGVTAATPPIPGLVKGEGKVIVYYYLSYLPAIDTAPTEGRMSRIEEPRTLRFGVHYNF